MKTILIAVAVAAFVLGTGLGYVLATGSASPAPHTMEEEMTSMSGELSGKTGEAFDREFLTQMIAHHEGAIDMAELALQHTAHEEIRSMANAIISTQTAEIEQMKIWLADWF